MPTPESIDDLVAEVSGPQPIDDLAPPAPEPIDDLVAEVSAPPKPALTLNEKGEEMLNPADFGQWKEDRLKEWKEATGNEYTSFQEAAQKLSLEIRGAEAMGRQFEQWKKMAAPAEVPTMSFQGSEMELPGVQEARVKAAEAGKVEEQQARDNDRLVGQSIAAMAELDPTMKAALNLAEAVTGNKFSGAEAEVRDAIFNLGAGGAEWMGDVFDRFGTTFRAVAETSLLEGGKLVGQIGRDLEEGEELGNPLKAAPAFVNELFADPKESEHRLDRTLARANARWHRNRLAIPMVLRANGHEKMAEAWDETINWWEDEGKSQFLARHFGTEGAKSMKRSGRMVEFLAAGIMADFTTYMTAGATSGGNLLRHAARSERLAELGIRKGLEGAMDAGKIVSGAPYEIAKGSVRYGPKGGPNYVVTQGSRVAAEIAKVPGAKTAQQALGKGLAGMAERGQADFLRVFGMPVLSPKRSAAAFRMFGVFGDVLAGAGKTRAGKRVVDAFNEAFGADVGKPLFMREVHQMEKLDNAYIANQRARIIDEMRGFRSSFDEAARKAIERDVDLNPHGKQLDSWLTDIYEGRKGENRLHAAFEKGLIDESQHAYLVEKQRQSQELLKRIEGSHLHTTALQSEVVENYFMHLTPRESHNLLREMVPAYESQGQRLAGFLDAVQPGWQKQRLQDMDVDSINSAFREWVRDLAKFDPEKFKDVDIDDIKFVADDWFSVMAARELSQIKAERHLQTLQRVGELFGTQTDLGAKALKSLNKKAGKYVSKAQATYIFEKQKAAAQSVKDLWDIIEKNPQKFIRGVASEEEAKRLLKEARRAGRMQAAASRKAYKARVALKSEMDRLGFKMDEIRDANEVNILQQQVVGIRAGIETAQEQARALAAAGDRAGSRAALKQVPDMQQALKRAESSLASATETATKADTLMTKGLTRAQQHAVISNMSARGYSMAGTRATHGAMRGAQESVQGPGIAHARDFETIRASLQDIFELEAGSLSVIGKSADDAIRGVRQAPLDRYYRSLRKLENSALDADMVSADQARIHADAMERYARARGHAMQNLQDLALNGNPKAASVLREARRAVRAEVFGVRGRGGKLTPSLDEQFSNASMRVQESMSSLYDARMLPSDTAIVTKGPLKGKALPTELVEWAETMAKATEPGRAEKFFRQYWDPIQRWWVSGVLSPFPAYHLRNIAGGVWQASLDGVKVKSFREGWDGLRMHAARGKDAAKDADLAGRLEAVYHIGQNGETVTMRKALQEAEELGILRHSSMRGTVDESGLRRSIIDETPNTMDGLRQVIRRTFSPPRVAVDSMLDERTAKALDVIGRVPLPHMPGATPANNIWYKAGMVVGDGQEDWIRFSHYWDKRKAGLGPEAARERVIMFHYDYAELGTLERQVFRRVMPFWAWSRNNVPRQIKEMFKQPGKFSRQFHGIRAVEAYHEDENAPVRSYPMYARRGGLVRWGQDKGKLQFFNLGFWHPMVDASFANPVGFHPLPVKIAEGITGVDTFRSDFARRQIRWRDDQTHVLGQNVGSTTALVLEPIRWIQMVDKALALNPMYNHPSAGMRASSALLGIRSYGLDSKRFYKRMEREYKQAKRAEERHRKRARDRGLGDLVTESDSKLRAMELKWREAVRDRDATFEILKKE